ncbi:MAG: thioesterase family protein [Thermoanaerobaculia bacterium]
MSVPVQAFRVADHVRWSDVDAAGILCYGAYVRFFEIAETELFRAAGLPYGKVFEELDFWLPRKALDFEFEAPALLDDRLEVAIWVERFGRSSIRFAFEIAKLGGTGERAQVTAKGHVSMVAVDRDQLRPVELPARLRTALAPFFVAPG